MHEGGGTHQSSLKPTCLFIIWRAALSGGYWDSCMKMWRALNGVAGNDRIPCCCCCWCEDDEGEGDGCWSSGWDSSRIGRRRLKGAELKGATLRYTADDTRATNTATNYRRRRRNRAMLRVLFTPRSNEAGKQSIVFGFICPCVRVSAHRLKTMLMYSTEVVPLKV